jgi:hypothetical protein
MSTTWLPYTAKTPQWLLWNNEVVDTPDLEVTQTGLKIRVAGRQDTAMFSKHLDRMMRQAANVYAETHGTKVYGRYHGPVVLPEGPDGPPFQTDWHGWWELADAAVPGAGGTIHLYINQRYGKEYRTQLQVQILGANGYVNAFGDREGPMEAMTNSYSGRPFRTMATQLMAMVNYLEENETIPLSVVQSREAMREWRVVRSNVSQDVITQLRDQMIEGNSLHEAFAHLKAFRRAMAQAGFAIKDVREADLMALAGAGKVVEMEFGTDDTAHAMTVDPLTGRVGIKCSRVVPKDDLAGAWETQRIIAELKGEEDAFLGFCRTNMFRI